MLTLFTLTLLWLVDSTNYNALAGKLLTRDTPLKNAAIAAAQTLTFDVPCGGTDWIMVQVDMTGGAAGDLGLTVVPYEADGVTLSGATLPAQAGTGYAATFGAGRVTAVQKYDTTGIDKVQVQIKNNNVGAQTVTRASWRAQNW